MTENLFGPLIGPWTLATEILNVYKLWTNEYLAELERKEGLRKRTIPRPPAEDSFHVGLDFASWLGYEIPAVRVVVEPTGQPERHASEGYTQDYEIKVGCVVRALGTSPLAEKPEEEAIALASYYGAAAMLLEDQRPELCEDLYMVESPRLSFPNQDDRTVVVSTTAFHCYVSQIKLLSAGPVQPLPKESPEYPGEPEGEWKEEPEVTKVEEIVVAEGQSEESEPPH